MEKVKEIAIRALKTAVQAFVAVVGLSATSLYNLPTLKAAAIAAAAGALSVIQNAVLAWSQS